MKTYDSVSSETQNLFYSASPKKQRPVMSIPTQKKDGTVVTGRIESIASLDEIKDFFGKEVKL